MNILLLEPDYKSKYPPLGLMKISSYHKLLGNNVVFFKGDSKKYLLEKRFYEFIVKYNGIVNEIHDYHSFEVSVKNYLRLRKIKQLQICLTFVPTKYYHTTENLLKYFAYKYKFNKDFDRVYISTLFTFHHKKIIEAIELAKNVIKNNNEIFIGGIAATLNSKRIARETNLPETQFIKGLLDKPSILGRDSLIIDDLQPDYSILEQTDYKYPLNTGYLSYMTRGCVNKCSFCAVPILEPNYKNKLSITNHIKNIRKIYGEMKDLILLDNNVLGSPFFKDIINEIKSLGFIKGAKYVEPNRFLYLYKLLISKTSPEVKYKYIERLYNYLICFGDERIKDLEERSSFHQLLSKNKIHSISLDYPSNISNIKDEINSFIERYRNKSKRNRFVDFNQGIDCRLLDEEKTKLLAEIPIRPLRIAFDSLSVRKYYESAVRLAAKYGIKELSNYILYNYQDKPENFWERLKINIDLNSELGLTIFSFPMKYVPVSGPQSMDRTYIGKYWNKKYLRAIQCISNVMKGVVMPGKIFFERAFGKNIEEYFEILLMPEHFILYRNKYEKNEQKDKWLYKLKNLTPKEFEEANKIILTNDFFHLNGTTNKSIISFLKIYQCNE